MLENTGTPALCLSRQEAGAAASCYLIAEGFMLTRMPSVSSLPPRLTLLLWPAGRQDF